MRQCGCTKGSKEMCEDGKDSSCGLSWVGVKVVGVWKQETDGEYRGTQLCNSTFMSVLCHCSIGILSVRGSVCAAIPGSQRMGDQMSMQIEYSTGISCSWYSFVWSPKSHVFGVPCLPESCIRNPKFSIWNQWSECCEEFGNQTCWAIRSVKWYMQQLEMNAGCEEQKLWKLYTE
ncbi:hypothetical protein CY35_01G075600 [Sphagnum magellanicum]|nr:hypothetical protein CY35_01G075600 [Sphagnum magellanicum]